MYIEMEIDIERSIWPIFEIGMRYIKSYINQIVIMINTHLLTPVNTAKYLYLQLLDCTATLS